MKWKIKQFVFCEHKQLLLSSSDADDNQEIVLEPRQAEVLAYFCRNPDRLISRDEMVEHVWQGQAVTDNAVNRIIAKLRKSLGDSAKQSEFIVTLPRKGYRFVCPVVELSDSKKATEIDDSFESTHSNNENSRSVNNSNYPKLAVISGLMVIAAFLIWKLIEQPPVDSMQQTSSYQFKSVKPLTRDKGEEFLPSISPDGRHLIYAAYHDKRLDLYLKDIQTDSSQLISDQKGNAGNGDWSRDGTRYLYFYNGEEKCELRIATFDPLQSMKLIDKQTVHQCRNRGFGSFAFGHDGRSIVFSEIDASRQHFSIYVKQLDTEQIEKIKQPPIFLAGNREFDLHPTENKLLIASPDQTQNLAFYVSDLDAGTLNKKFSMEGFICCPVWGHQGDKIIMTGALPAYTIVEMDLDGDNLKTIYSAAHSIHRLKRAPKSNSFVYSGGIQNTDIRAQEIESGEKTTLISSTVPDYLPVLSHKESHLAYISQRSGNSEVWIRDLKLETDRKLTQFADNQQYFDLKWSPNDQKIIALTINHIKLVDFVSGQDLTLTINPQQIRGLSWIDDNKISLSLKEGEHFSLYEYDLLSKSLKKSDSDYAYQVFDSSSDGNIGIDTQGSLYYQNKPLAVTIDNPINHNRRFSFQLHANYLYYIAKISLPNNQSISNQSSEKSKAIEKYQLRKYNLNSGEVSSVATFDYPVSFSIGKKTLYTTFLADRNADIFRVDFQID